MNFFHLIRMCVLCTVLFGFVGNAEISMMRSELVRDIRFSNFSMTFPNESVGTVLECGIRMLRNKQMLYLHYNIYKRLTDIQGEYSNNNFTINAEQFGALFSYPFERWWDRYWKVNFEMHGGEDQSVIFSSLVQFYFLTYRIRHH